MLNVLPTEHALTVSLGLGDGTLLGREVAVLERPVEWMRYCEVCDGEKRFVAEMECQSGLIGYCANCGEEGFAPFTRAIGEAC